MKCRIDVGGIFKRMQSMANNGLAAAAEQALTDCNYYAPKQYGFLIASSEHSDVKTGRLEWVTPYARRLYFDKKLRIKRGKNPNATREWADVAKRNHMKDWELAFKKGMK